MQFADKLFKSIQERQTLIVAGFDPVLDSLPKFILELASSKTTTSADAIYLALVEFHSIALQALQSKVAAIKINIAFFEQYGIPGVIAFTEICKLAKEHQLLLIADAKRGDIGNTAKAYSAAFLGQATAFGQKIAAFDVDALTVNPYLGFDTVESYLDDCIEFGKGLFVLVKTSNPGSNQLQGLCGKLGKTVAEEVAIWLAEKAEVLKGTCGLSGLGAVVGATYPEEAIKLRSLMPKNYFLIPGMGAQGGSAKDAVAGLAAKKSGGIINISRGLLGGMENLKSKEEITKTIHTRIDKFNAEIAAA